MHGLIGLAVLGIWLVQGTAWVALFSLITVVSAMVSTSHLWELVKRFRYPSSAWVVDDEHGMRILLPMENKQAHHLTMTSESRPTWRAADLGYTRCFLSIDLALGFFRFGGESRPSPLPLM